MTIEVAPEEKFSVSFRILGNEIFAVDLSSQSDRKNWAIFGLIALVLLTLFAQQLLPLIIAISAIT